MPTRYDPRPISQRMREVLEVWAYILGLSAMLVTWSLLAWASIGSGTVQYPDYNLANPTPAAQTYNTIREYQRPQR